VVSIKSSLGHVTLNLCLCIQWDLRVTVYSSAFRALTVDELFCMVGWAGCGFHKKHARTRYAKLVFLHPVGYAGHIVHSCASGARNVDALFLMLRFTQCSFNKKRAETRYAKLVFLHPVGSAGHVLHSCTYGVQNIDALFSCLGGPGAVFINGELRHITLNLCFCIQWDLRVT
jgi:hypothetical protein